MDYAKFPDKGKTMDIDDIIPEFYQRSALSPLEDTKQEVLGITNSRKSRAENFISYFLVVHRRVLSDG